MLLLSTSASHASPVSPPRLSYRRIAETLSDEVLAKLHAPPKPSYPVLQPADLAQFDAFIFGIPTRFGNFPAQWKAFWDATGGLWASGALAGKYASVFVSTASPGGGQGTCSPVRFQFEDTPERYLYNRNDCFERPFNPCPPRYHLRSSRLQPNLCPVN